MEYFLGPTRTLRLGGKRYYFMIVDDYPGYTLFLRQWKTDLQNTCMVAYNLLGQNEIFLVLSIYHVWAGLLLFFNSYNTSHFPAEDSLDDRGGAGWRRQGQSCHFPMGLNFSLTIKTWRCNKKT